MLQRLNLRAFHLLFHQLKAAVAIVEPKRFWRYELKVGLKGGIGLFALLVQKLEHEWAVT